MRDHKSFMKVVQLPEKHSVEKIFLKQFYVKHMR
jgi:hypothetical protein